RADLEAAQGRLAAQRTAIVRKIASGLITDDDAAEALTEIKAELMRIDADLHQLRLEPKRADLKAERDRVLKLAADFPAILRRADPARARELLGHWVEGGTLDKATRTAVIQVRRLPVSAYLPTSAG